RTDMFVELRIPSEKPSLKVDHDKCIRCRLCERICPVKSWTDDTGRRNIFGLKLWPRMHSRCEVCRPAVVILGN
ncbi:MAG: 4Fe-4S binding protein, partial [Spirochaetaceae bacterium]|nr:4Fe-4S binding protein [Spirochaetaceae bacterium]